MTTEIRLFGPLRMTIGGVAVKFATDHARALLVYLLVEARAHERSELAAFLWPKQSAPVSRHNLRQTLLTLKQSLQCLPHLDQHLEITPKQLAFHAGDIHVDYLQFQQHLAECTAHRHADLDPCVSCISRLQQAVALYRGEFLQGLELKNSSPFVEWLVYVRRQVSRLSAEAQTIAGSTPHKIEAESPHLPNSGAPKAEKGLPVFLTPFVDRQLELAEIITQLHEPEVRLLTLVGPGGMGKTRLALEAAKKMDALHFPDGTIFVSLAGLSDPTGVAPAISVSLGLNANGGDLQQTLFQSLSTKRLLLILDNVEQLLPDVLSSLPEEERQAAVTLIVELLQHAPGIKILVTARQRLALSSEHLIPVQGLEFGAGVDSGSASTSAAVRLFVQSAQRIQPHYQLESTELATLLEICHLLQGMPLALEMAAVWIDQLSLAEIADEIKKSIDFLTVEWWDVPERQRSMRTLLAWSWQLLNEAERHTLQRIALFHGGFTLHAAQAVAGATLPILTRLIYKSLLQWQENPVGDRRYVMHGLWRQFAAEKLDAAEYAIVEEQHGRYYLAFVAERGLRLERGEPKEASAEIQVELDNVRQAWQWAVRGGHIVALEEASYGW
jgi:predicted ATPase